MADERARSGLRRWGRAGRALAAGVACGLLAAVVLGAGVASLAGVRVLTVRSGSMEPSIRTGDAVVVHRIRPSEIRVGDVVTFTDPTASARLITHRVRAARLTSRHAHVTTKGDANTGVETWTMPARGELGLVRHRLPRAGYALAWSQSRSGRLLLVVLPALLWSVYELRRIWRRPAPDPQLRLF
jgi:signal peptidase I